MASSSLALGDAFSSFADVKKAVENYEKSNFVNMYVSDSKTLQAAAKSAPKVAQKANKELVNYIVLYTCINGGQKFKSQSKGDRPHQSISKC